MAGVPSDIHSQIVDSFTESFDEPSISIHHRMLLLKHRRCLIKTAELERKMCAQRIDISRWSSRLQQERLTVLKSIKSARTPSSNDEICHTHQDLHSLIEDNSIGCRVRDFIDGSYNKNEQELCQAVEELKRKYPVYQIHSVETIAEAIDALISIVEVSIEDTNLLDSKIKAVSKETEELRQKNKELSQLIEQYERSARRKRGRLMTSEYSDALIRVGQRSNQAHPLYQPRAYNGQELPCSEQQKYISQYEIETFPQPSNGHPTPSRGAHSNKNFLGLTLESVKVRRKNAP